MAARKSKTPARSVTELDIAIGRRIAERRYERRMSQPVLAQKIGVSFQQVQKYELGSNRIPASRLFLVAGALRCRVECLYPQTDQKTKNLETTSAKSLHARR
jgi:transcriptional regulator with XRE-family HTH domain